MPSDDPIARLSDDELLALFVKNLKKVFPDLKDTEILHKKAFRAKYVQPLQELNYLERAIAMKTPLSGVYAANTSMIYNSTLNNNAVITLATQAAENILADSGVIISSVTS
jgi:protoporphyrinogen oxidase